jgi:hypothetical protein
LFPGKDPCIEKNYSARQILRFIAIEEEMAVKKSCDRLGSADQTGRDKPKPALGAS